MNSLAISFKEVKRIKKNIKIFIPNEVIESLNEFILKNWNRNEECSIVFKECLIKKVSDRLNLSEKDIINNNYLDYNEIKAIYYQVGWNVLCFKNNDENFSYSSLKFEKKHYD